MRSDLFDWKNIIKFSKKKKKLTYMQHNEIYIKINIKCLNNGTL